MYIDERINKKTDKPYFITTALIDDGSEAEFFGEGLRIGDEVEVFYHFGKIKCRRKEDRGETKTTAHR